MDTNSAWIDKQEAVCVCVLEYFRTKILKEIIYDKQIRQKRKDLTASHLKMEKIGTTVLDINFNIFAMTSLLTNACNDYGQKEWMNLGEHSWPTTNY